MHLRICAIISYGVFGKIKYQSVNQRVATNHHAVAVIIKGNSFFLRNRLKIGYDFFYHWGKIDSDPGAVRAKAYDIVLNGTELGGGSVRIHQDDIQEKMFEVLGFTKERAHEQFGFLLDAFSYGVPPHAGLAFGVDRICMHMLHTDNIKEVIAFPKVKDASDLMSEAPGTVDPKQLDELGIAVVAKDTAEEATEE